MRRDEQPLTDRERLEHMLSAGRDAVIIAAGRTRQTLDEDITVRHALVHCVEMVGEAAARVSEEARSRVPGLPWARVVGMRHILIHAYYKIDLDAVWGVVAEHIPQMIPLLEEAMRNWPAAGDAGDAGSDVAEGTDMP